MMAKEIKSEVIIYQTEDGQTKIEVLLNDNNVWLPLDKIAQLFSRDKSTISRHLKNVFEEGELQQNSVVANFATTAADGKIYQVDYYNLSAIISVGYETLNKFSGDFGMGVLEDAGSVSHETAVNKAHHEYEAYRSALPDDLSNVEKAYLAALKEMQKKLKKGEGAYD